VLETAKLVDVLADLEDRIRDVVRVILCAKEEMVRKPDGFLIGGTLRDGAVVERFKV